MITILCLRYARHPHYPINTRTSRCDNTNHKILYPHVIAKCNSSVVVMAFSGRRVETFAGRFTLVLTGKKCSSKGHPRPAYSGRDFAHTQYDKGCIGRYALFRSGFTHHNGAYTDKSVLVLADDHEDGALSQYIGRASRYFHPFRFRHTLHKIRNR